MKILASIIVSLLCFRSHAAVTLQWNCPTNDLLGFVMFHGTDNQPPEIYNVGLANNWTYQPALTIGTHYFTVAAVGTNGLVGYWSPMLAITNVVAVNVNYVLLRSTNLTDWMPVQTNRLLLCATNPAEFFRAATTIQSTNVMLLPAPR